MYNKSIKSFESNGFNCEVVGIENNSIKYVLPHLEFIRSKWYNGYVIVPNTHPWYNVDYNDIDVSVHGGLTYSGKEGEFWKVGFDTNHYGDTLEEWDETATIEETISLAKQDYDQSVSISC